MHVYESQEEYDVYQSLIPSYIRERLITEMIGGSRTCDTIFESGHYDLPPNMFTVNQPGSIMFGDKAAHII